MRSEAQIQSDCVLWLWNNKPATRGLFFAITNNSENIGRAMQRKAMGLVSGVADTCFLWRGRAYWIEFKSEDGNQSPAQKDWEKTIERHGFDYLVIRSLSEFQTLINYIMCRKLELTKDQEWELFNFVLGGPAYRTGDFKFQDSDELYRYTIMPHPLGYHRLDEFCLIEGDDLMPVDYAEVNQMLREEWWQD